MKNFSSFHFKLIWIELNLFKFAQRRMRLYYYICIRTYIYVVVRCRSVFHVHVYIYENIMHIIVCLWTPTVTFTSIYLAYHMTPIHTMYYGIILCISNESKWCDIYISVWRHTIWRGSASLCVCVSSNVAQSVYMSKSGHHKQSLALEWEIIYFFFYFASAQVYAFPEIFRST